MFVKGEGEGQGEREGGGGRIFLLADEIVFFS